MCSYIIQSARGFCTVTEYEYQAAPVFALLVHRMLPGVGPLLCFLFVKLLFEIEGLALL